MPIADLSSLGIVLAAAALLVGRTRQGRLRSIWGARFAVAVGALVIGLVAFLTTRPTRTDPASTVAADHAAPAATNAPTAAIDVTARHLGDLKVLIGAQRSARSSRLPIAEMSRSISEPNGLS